MIASIIAAAIAAVGSIIAAWVATHNSRKLSEVHGLVNSRLDESLAEIKRLQRIVNHVNHHTGNGPENDTSSQN